MTCLSCLEGNPRGECPRSGRECGHHCNHSWDQDECCWCGAEFGDQDDPGFGVPTNKEDTVTIIPTPIDHMDDPKVTVNLDSLDDAQQNLLNAERTAANAAIKRADIVRRLRNAGYRDQVIADRLGVSRGRIGQIAGPRRRPQS